MSRELDLLEFAEGNPGCIQFLMEASQRPEIMDIIKLLRETGLKGSRAYKLWSDCCGRDMDQVAAVADAYASGRLTKEKTLDHVDLPFGEPFTEEELKGNGIRVAVARVGEFIPTRTVVRQCAEQLFGAKDIGKHFLVSIEAESIREFGRDTAQIKIVKKEVQ